MTKSLILSVLSFAILLHVSQASVIRKSIKSYESKGINTAVVYIDVAGYLEVSIEGNILSVNNTFQHSNSLKPCKLIIDPFEDAILGQIKAMGFMQSIVVWGVRGIDNVDEIKHTRYTMLLIDPRKCSYRPLHLPIDEVPMDHPTLSPIVQVVPHETSTGNALYIFFPTLKRCAPCQYHPKDLRITDVTHQIQPLVMGPSKSFHVQAFVDLNARVHNGYLLAYNYGIGTARLEYLSRNFTILAKRYLNHTVDATSIIINKENRQNIVTCWQHNPDQITCERFDSTLNSKASYHLEGDSVSILFDKYENAYISTARKFGEVRVSIYNVFGQLIDKLDFDSKVKNSVRNLEVYGFLEDFENPHEYCLVISELPQLLRTKTDYSIKCISVYEYAKIP